MTALRNRGRGRTARNGAWRLVLLLVFLAVAGAWMVFGPTPTLIGEYPNADDSVALVLLQGRPDGHGTPVDVMLQPGSGWQGQRARSRVGRYYRSPDDPPPVWLNQDTVMVCGLARSRDVRREVPIWPLWFGPTIHVVPSCPTSART